MRSGRGAGGPLASPPKVFVAGFGSPVGGGDEPPAGAPDGVASASGGRCRASFMGGPTLGERGRIAGSFGGVIVAATGAGVNAQRLWARSPRRAERREGPPDRSVAVGVRLFLGLD